MLSPRRKALIIALIIFFVLSALAILASPLSARSLEARLKRAADEAVYSVRAEDWAQVEMDGQVAIITGLAPSPAARDRVVAAVQRSAWAGGVVAGGITKVVDRMRLDLEEAGFVLRADLVAGRVTLTGFAPDADGRARLVEIAELLFPGRASVNLRLAPGAAPAGWDAAARTMLAELSRLDTGTALMEGRRLVVYGLGEPGEVRAVRDTLRDGPPGFLSAALVRSEGGEYRTTIADPGLCEVAIRAALGPRAVAFSPGGAELTEASRNTLRRAGDAFSRCESGPLTVAVRPLPGEGGPGLALERAEAVIAAMQMAGPGPERFTAEVLPATAQTAIEFEVSGEPPLQGEVREDRPDAETEG